MAMMSPRSGDGDFEKSLVSGSFELGPNELELLYPDYFDKGRTAEFSTLDGKKMFSLSCNPESNWPEKTFTLRLANGVEVLLAENTLFLSRNFAVTDERDDALCGEGFVASALQNAFPADFEINIEKNGTVHFQSLEKAVKYKFEAPPPKPKIQAKVIYEHVSEQELGPEWKDVAMAPDRLTAFYSWDGKYCGAIYQVPGVEGQYIFRDRHRKEAVRIDEGHPLEVVMDQKLHHKVRAKVEGGRLAIQGDTGVRFAVANMNSLQKVQQGASGHIGALINGGRQIYAVTKRELGYNPKYTVVNEDNVGINVANGRVAWADGMGGNGFGEMASSKAVATSLEAPGSVKYAIEDARNELYLFGRQFIRNSRYAPNTLLGLIQFEGDRFEAAHFGDLKWRLIRGNKIVAKSTEHSVVGELYEQGAITLEQAMNHDQRNIVTTSLGGGTDAPDITSVTMEPGDILVAYDDGIALTDEELIEWVENVGPEGAAERIMQTTERRNSDPERKFLAEDENRNVFEAPSPVDNAVLVVYKHD